MKYKSEKKSFARYVAGIFWNFDEGRLRAMWRLIIAAVFTAILTFVLGAPFFMVSGGIPAPYIEKILLYVAAVVAIWLATRLLDKRPFSDTGIYLERDWWVDLGFGLLLGAFLMTVIFLIELAAGWITIREFFVTGEPGQSFLVALSFPLLLYLIVGSAEELMFRGYLLLNLAEGFNGRAIGPRWSVLGAWLLTSAAFGVAHGFLPNATVVSTINIILAGIWLGLAYVLSGSLAVSIGAHFTWNLFQGYVYGFPVSGGRDFTTTAIAILQGGPATWTGGAFGPEGGLLGLLGFLIGILLVVVWVRQRYGRLALHLAIAHPS